MNGHAPVQNHGLPMKSEFDDTAADVGLRGRITDFTFANFTCTQSTGAVVIMLSETPHQFHGLQTIGVIIFIFNIVVFLCFCAVMLTRFILHPHMLKKSVTTPPECFFIGSFWLSMATVIMSMQQFGVPHTGFWVVVAIRVLFWMYAAVTLIYATAMFTMLYLKSILTPSQIQPAMFISVYNTMLTGTIAAFIARSQPPAARLPIIVAGVAYQGLGCAQYLPPSYDYFARHPNGVEMLQVMADWIGVFLWLFTFWLFATALLVNLPTAFPRIGARYHVSPRMNFELGWWSIIFPNVGFTLATGYIGRQFQSNSIRWIATIMTVLLFAFWLMNLALHAKSAVLAVRTLNKTR